MSRAIIAAVLSFFLLPSLSAQTTHVFNSAIGKQTEMGFEKPSLQFGYSVYKTHGQSEFSAHAGWSPDNKRATGDGNSIALRFEQTVFLTENFGLNGGFRHAHLWTSQFKKGGWVVAPGVLLRSAKWAPFRIQLNYLHHIGPTIDKHGVESNLVRGFDLSPEIRAGSFAGVGVLYGWTITSAKGYNQGNPDCDGTYITKPLTCPRGSWTATTAMMRIRLQIPATGANQNY